jgi:hypothetical protein
MQLLGRNIRMRFSHLIVLVFILCVTQGAPAASIYADSGYWTGRSDSDSAWFAVGSASGPDAARIRWTSGHNVTDELTHAFREELVEGKFAFNPSAGKTVGRNFTGFTRNDGPGQYGSTTYTHGEGSSSWDDSALWWPGSAQWSVTATGTLGSNKKAYWRSQATGRDPMVLTASDFGTINGPTYDLFFEGGLLGGDFSRMGSIGLDVSYISAGSALDLLRISISDGAVDVTGGHSNLTIYRLTGTEQNPDDVTQTMSLAAIQTLLLPDITGDRTVDSPLRLGFLLSGIPVPTVDMGGGELAHIAVNARAADADGVPEPSSMILMGIGLSALLARRITRSSSLSTSERVSA